ncbi:uncharacterized protein [Penaeus vannamei]|uniref:uncharacterized protein n=1 Tax=Penaeus vannamei TaxID=6689 RepID=UPI00387F3CC0
MFFFNGKRKSRVLLTLLLMATSSLGASEVSNPEDFEDASERSPWMTDPESFWDAVDAFLDLHDQVPDGKLRPRRQKRGQSEDDYGDNFEDDYEDNDDDYGDNFEDDYEDNDDDDYADNYDGEDGSENIFQFLHTPTGYSPGWDNIVDLVQFAVDIHEAVSRIAEHGEYDLPGDSGDDQKQFYSYSWDRRRGGGGGGEEKKEEGEGREGGNGDEEGEGEREEKGGGEREGKRGGEREGKGGGEGERDGGGGGGKEEKEEGKGREGEREGNRGGEREGKGGRERKGKVGREREREGKGGGEREREGKGGGEREREGKGGGEREREGKGGGEREREGKGGGESEGKGGEREKEGKGGGEGERERKEATDSFQEEGVEGGPLTESSPPEGTKESDVPELQTNFRREEGIEGEDGIREEKEGREEWREDETASDRRHHDRFPRSERGEGKTSQKGKNWRHKPFITSFSTSFPLFQFDLPFSNFRLLSLQDPLPLPEE